MLLFVYGTFCRGLSRNTVLKDSVYLGIASCKGKLIDIGFYPALIQGDEKVVGEVYKIDPEVLLTKLDEIEGYSKNSEAGSLYIRGKTLATLFSTGDNVDVSLYYFNKAPKKYPPISCGDYRRYLLDQNTSPVYYLAYGSNLSTSRLKGRIGQWGKTITGSIPDYRLVYNKDDGTGHAYANITVRTIDKSCPAVAYEVSRESILFLDGCEGVHNNHYIRTVLPFKSDSGEEIMGYVYIATTEKLVWGKKPTEKYREHLLDGYMEHNLGKLELYESC